MSKNNRLLSFVFSAVLALLCTGNGVCSSQLDDQEILQQSLKKWKQLREKHQGNYTYKVVHEIYDGLRMETNVVFQKNKLVERRYSTYRFTPGFKNDPAHKKTLTEWIEKGESLGTHDEGFPGKSLDELYELAKKVLKRKLQPHERRYFRCAKNGLLGICILVDTRIQDDGTILGVEVSEIVLGDPSAIDKKPSMHKAPNGNPFPKHWGAPPRIQTRDLRPLPGSFGQGSGTLARWIQKNLDNDKRSKDSVGKDKK